MTVLSLLVAVVLVGGGLFGLPAVILYRDLRSGRPDPAYHEPGR